MLTSGRPAPAVVIVAYRSDDDLAQCLATLGRSEDVLVVDNDDSPTTRELCLEAGVAYLPSPHNPGFATAVNLGLARQPGRDVLLLNPDARITWSDVLTLQSALHQGGHAAVGPELMGADGAPQRADWPLPSPGQVWLDAVGLSRFWRGRRFVTGAVLLLNARAVAELGGFDERYFLYAEEADWQRRALDAGWTLVVVETVRATHIGATSSSDPSLRDEHSRRSGALYADKWFGPVGVALMGVGSRLAALRRQGPSSLVGRRHAGVPGRARVVHVVRSDGFAGVERYIIDAATETSSRGWDVVVVGGDPEEMRAALPERVTHLPARTVAQVAVALYRHRHADVVHAHMTAAELPAALLKSRHGRLVVTRHFAARRGSTWAIRLSGKTIRRRIDVQISVSNFVAQSIGERSVVLHSGVQPSTLAPVERERVILVLQRLEPEKDTMTAIRAWNTSGLVDQGWRMVVHGAGSQLFALRNAAGAGVEFAGATDAPRTVLSKSAVLLAPTPREGLGLGVVEAMAEGVPVVAADGGAHRETLGPDGIYFAPGDPDSAAAALRALADDPRRCLALGEQLKRRQQEHFSVSIHVDRLIELYAE